MSAARSWIEVRAEVTRRVRDGLWRPGDRIPGEAELAAEFGCARATAAGRTPIWIGSPISGRCRGSWCTRPACT